VLDYAGAYWQDVQGRTTDFHQFDARLNQAKAEKRRNFGRTYRRTIGRIAFLIQARFVRAQ